MKKPTAVDVAKSAGVSQATVSFVLNNNPDIVISEATRKRVMDAVQRLGYVPRVKSSNYSKPTDNLLALFVPNISNIFYPALARNIENYAMARGYKILIVNTNRNMHSEKYYLDLMQSIKIAGIIYGFTPAFPNVVKAVSLKIPVVIIGEAQDGLDVDIISLDSHKAGGMMAQHLLELGHKRIAFISSPMSKISLSRQRRLEGVADLIGAKNIGGGLVMLSDENEQELSNSIYEFETGYGLAKRLVKNENVTAVIGANDMIAYGVIKALGEEKIKVPSDISVCGFDNIFIPGGDPLRLTTIDHCIEQRCRLAVDLLDDKIKGKTQAAMKINYEPILIKGGTTANAEI